MGIISKYVKKAGNKAGNAVAKMASLSPSEIEKLDEERVKYLSEKPEMDDPTAVELTNRLLAANSVEIFNAYVSQIDELYVPVEKMILMQIIIFVISILQNGLRTKMKIV